MPATRGAIINRVAEFCNHSKSAVSKRTTVYVQSAHIQNVALQHGHRKVQNTVQYTSKHNRHLKIAAK